MRGPSLAWSQKRRRRRAPVASAGCGDCHGRRGRAVLGAAAGNPGVGAAMVPEWLSPGERERRAGERRLAATLQSRYDMAYLQCMYAKGNPSARRGRRPWPRVAPTTRRPQGSRPPPPQGARSAEPGRQAEPSTARRKNVTWAVLGGVRHVKARAEGMQL